MHPQRTAAALASAVAVLLLVGCSSPSPSPVMASVAAEPAPTPVATFGAVPTTALPGATAAALTKALRLEVGTGSPDALATVITPDGIWSGAAGVDGPDGRRAAVGDVVSIASVTKIFTSAVVLRLAEQKRMDLDAPLARYLDAAAAKKANGATVRQALAMRAGLPDTQDAVREAALADPEHLSTVDGIVAALPAPTTMPGTESGESNPTYKLLALAAERAAGAPWADLVDTLRRAPACTTVFHWFLQTSFPRTTAAVPTKGIVRQTGDATTAADRRVVAAMWRTLLDGWIQVGDRGDFTTSRGLRGGSLRDSDDGESEYDVDFTDYRFVGDLGITGRLVAPFDERPSSGTFDLTGSGGTGRLTITTHLRLERDGLVTITGTVNGNAVSVTTSSF